MKSLILMNHILRNLLILRIMCIENEPFGRILMMIFQFRNYSYDNVEVTSHKDCPDNRLRF